MIKQSGGETMRVYLKARIRESMIYQDPSLIQILIVESKGLDLIWFRPIANNDGNSINEKRSYTSFDKYPSIVAVGNSKTQNR